MDNIVSFGYWIRRRRKALDLTQDALARQVGCSVFTIRKIERDERRPSRQIADLLAVHLVIPTEERDHFLRLARGEFVASVPSPIEDLPPPHFLQGGQELVTDNDPPFVARTPELAQLDKFLKHVLTTGKGQVVFAIGEAGTGKTALVQEFSRRAQTTQRQLIVAGGNCQALTGIGDPYLPFREILGLLTGDVETRWNTGALGQEQARRLWTIMPHTVQALVTHGSDLLDIFIPGMILLQRATSAAPAGADWPAQLQQGLARQKVHQAPAHRQQYDLFEQYTTVLMTLARQHPLLLILDDLQWADAGSINLLFHLGRQLEGSPILVLGVYRPSDVASGRDGQRHPLEAVVNEFQRSFGDIHINLSQSEGQQFVETLLDSEPNQLDTKFRKALYRQTQGHALFTVEMLRGLQERGDLVQDAQGRWIAGPQLDWQTLPARVEGTIGERIERLPAPAQEILKTASVQGELFTAEVVAQVQGIDELQLVRQLSVLDRQHRLVRSQSSQRLSKGGRRVSEHRFRHILFQRFLYNSLDEVERVYLHEAVGTALEHLYEAQTDDVTVQLAHHFRAAGIPEKAIGYLQKAGERAVRLSAHEEAIGHFSQAVELLEALPDRSQYAHQELGMQLALGQALYVVKGSASLELEHTLGRTRLLAEQLGETHQLFRVLWGLVALNIMRGQIQQVARTLAEQMLQLAQSQQDPTLLIGAHLAQGLILDYLGELAPAAAHFEQSLALYDSQQSPALISLYGQDPAVFCWRRLALAKWLLGYPEQGLSLADRAISHAQRLAHPFSLVGAQAVACIVHYCRREVRLLEKLAMDTVALSVEHGAVLWQQVGSAFHGWAMAEQGQAKEGIKQICQSLDAWSAMGARADQDFLQLLLAGAFLNMGQITEGLVALEQALQDLDKTDEHTWEAEVYRLKGELLLRKNISEEEAEQQFLTAIDIARRQGAKSWELRATVSLGRLWQAQGKKAEARQILTKIYHWFTEGFDTVDLKEAKALLEELA